VYVCQGKIQSTCSVAFPEQEPGMDAFRCKFEKMLSTEPDAARLVAKIIARAEISRENLISLLEWVTDPKRDQKLRRGYSKTKDWVPARKQISALASRMERLAEDTERLFGGPIYNLHSESSRYMALAKTLKEGAAAARKFPRPKARALSHKAFWKHVPATLFCISLGVPQQVSYSQAEHLWWFASLARSMQLNQPDRALEREQRRFSQSSAGEVLRLLLPLIFKELPGKLTL
jgi:hypothetical protein